MESRITVFLALLLIASLPCIVSASKKKIRIPDKLDDIIDDEEDEEWREWGKPKTQSDFDPPSMDSDTMDLHEMQEKMMKRQAGPVYGFVKLQPGRRRTPAMVSETAMKWTRMARTGAIDVKFSGVDLSTIMFSMERGQDALELKDFLLSQSEAYEVKLGDKLFRRPGDPSVDEVFEKLQAEKTTVSGGDGETHHKEL